MAPRWCVRLLGSIDLLSRVYVSGSIPERDAAGKLYNTATVYSPSGSSTPVFKRRTA